ncbi:MAG: hypothetical protein H0U58_07795 [Chloroflexi bacterium]|nr:hypothetical protein [Chloroflexota bacterium]
MDQRPDPITRLGPASRGRTPRPAEIRSRTWEWGPEGDQRPGLPWIGIFLLVFGGLLVVQQLLPGARSLGSLAVLAVGIAFLVKWLMNRGTGSLYVGAIITALAVPGVLDQAGLDVDGLGTFCFGVAFLFIAAVRAFSGGGAGWQAWFGGLLTLLGAVNMLTPQVGGLIVPVVLVVIGALLVFGGAGRGRRR